MPPKKRGKGYDQDIADQFLRDSRQIQHPSGDIITRNTDFLINPVQNSGYKFKTDSDVYKKMIDICDKQYHTDYPHFADDVYPQLDKIGTENSLTKIYDTFLPVLDQYSGAGRIELALHKLKHPAPFIEPIPKSLKIPEHPFLALNSGQAFEFNKKLSKR